MNENEEFENLIDPALKESIATVIEELQKLLPGVEFNSLTVIPEDTVVQLFEIDNISIPAKLKTHINTPYSIAKYLMLKDEEDILIDKVTKDLNTIIDEDKVTLVVHRDLTNTLTFTKKLQINSEEKPQNLSIKYTFNPETDRFNYMLDCGSWGWNVSKDQLKALVNGKALPKIQTELSEELPKSKENDIVINVNNTRIIIQKL